VVESTTFDRKRIYANPSSYPNPNHKAQCFRTDEMTSFFDQVYRYRQVPLCPRPHWKFFISFRELCNSDKNFHY